MFENLQRCLNYKIKEIELFPNGSNSSLKVIGQGQKEFPYFMYINSQKYDIGLFNSGLVHLLFIMQKLAEEIWVKCKEFQPDYKKVLKFEIKGS